MNSARPCSDKDGFTKQLIPDPLAVVSLCAMRAGGAGPTGGVEG